jgi:hypothetical protein
MPDGATTDLPDAVRTAMKADEAAVAVDHAGNMVAITEPLRELLGLPEDEYLLGEPVELLVPSDRRFGHQAYRRGYIAEPALREMDPGLHPEAEHAETGELVPIHVDLEPVRVEGRLYTVAHVTRRDS